MDGLGVCVARNDSRSRDAVTRIDGHRGRRIYRREVACRIAATLMGANRRGSVSSPEQIAAAPGASRDRASGSGEGRRRGNETLKKEETRFPIFQQYRKSGTSSSEIEAVVARRHTRCQFNAQKIYVPRQAKTHVCPLAFM